MFLALLLHRACTRVFMRNNSPFFFFHVCKWVCVFVSSCKRHQRGQENPLYVFLRTDPFLCRPACVFCFFFLFFVFCFLFVCLSVLLKPGTLGHIGIRFSFPPSPSPFAAEGSKQAKKKKTTRTLRVGQKTRLASILPSCFFNEPLWEEEKKKK